MKHKLLAITVSVVVGLGLAPAGPQASASTADSSGGDKVVYPDAKTSFDLTSIDPYVLEDMETVAQEEGIAVDEAAVRYGWHGDFSLVAMEVEQSHPDAFAGAEVDASGGQIATVSFVEEMPSGVIEILQRSPVPVRVLENVGLSLADRAETVEAAHYAVYGELLRLSGGDTPDTSSYFDDSAMTVRVSVATSATDLVSSSRLGELAGAAVEEKSAPLVAQGKLTSVPRVQVDLVEGDVAGEDTIRGGAYLTTGSQLVAACTSGWPVKKLNSTQKGLITADHCTNSLRYSGRNVLTWRKRLPSNRGDIDYRSSSESVGRAFYYATGQYRKVTGLSTPVNNQRLCKFGRKSKNTCDNVRDRTTCRNSYCNLVSMDNRKAAGGDSGGPWYSGSTAYGVHSGYHWSFLKKRDQFTPVYNTLADLGLKLRTG